MAEVTCSDKDNAVLNCIFNPHLPLGDASAATAKPSDTLIDSEYDSQLLERAKQLEVEGIKHAERGDVASAINKFSESIQLLPSRPSGYNNRAQALRLHGDIDGAMADLDKTIEFSSGKGLSASQAYTQRALLKKLSGDDDAALDDFKRAAALGNDFAKAQVVEMNPYAAMCNQMLSSAFKKLKGENS
ncbi:uncharacterized protein TRIADDRAFT_26445 [Trichoplax adhaerens]|uniref:Uncharacterized protein n=1 Tax=Trichoplax adhaerens TaxID=10228 RepID=B3S066_TRIAD|nr:hypothetical protein TRIADDRAFT_26445 [Trichoplax adhaerens]EDV23953.1 hypothetical protein TRIADDRAFT_26445 [Trichoplax adhaerens]|eukprot:XP_002113479.1 hypothetical protein TRIADDRAFT_26445 [Trichoplax adhaerens]